MDYTKSTKNTIKCTMCGYNTPSFESGDIYICLLCLIHI